MVRARDEGNLENDYNNERHILSSLRCLKHPSIIRLVAAFSKGDTYNLLFPVADGDLKHLLSLEQRPVLLGSDQAIFDALWSLSSAVESIHLYFAKDFNVRQVGCHYDIKPGNILYQGEKFLLSDFGLSRLRDNSEGSRSLYKGVEGSYVAPECEPSSKGFERAMIGRTSDVWSFGCFLFEMLAYLHGGPQRVNELHTARRKKLGPLWAHYFHAGDSLNPAVTEFLQSFHDGQPKGDAFRALSDTIRAALQIEPEKRINASQMTLCLFHLAQRCRFRAICSLLEDGADLRDFEFGVECLRLKIWAEAVGIASPWEDIPETAWLANPRNHEELGKVQDSLRKCHEEIDFVITDIEINRPITHNRYYHLQRSQDDLWNMQPASVRNCMLSRLEDTVLNENGRASLADSKTLLYEQGAYRYEFKPGISTEEVSGSVYRRITWLSLVKQVASAIMNQKSPDRDLVFDKNLLSEPFASYHCHFLAFLSVLNRNVLVERMVYQESWYSHVGELLQRIKTITAFRNNIQDLLPILKSRGYYHEPSKHYFGIVYELPYFAQDTLPMSLLDIINQTDNRSLQPSLSLKFDLAIKLVDCVLSLHKAGWLHKNISSINIMCFPGVFLTKAASIARPWLIGFNYSRLNGKTVFTEGPGHEHDLRDYQHPEYLKKMKRDHSQHENTLVRYTQEFEYYSVGLVLMEVGLWKVLHRVTKYVHGSPQQMLEHLLKHIVPVIKTHMGDFYGDAITACLTSDFGGSEDPNESRRAFESQVVNPIRERRV